MAIDFVYLGLYLSLVSDWNRCVVMVLSQSISHSRINHVLFVLQEKINLFLNGSLFAEVPDTSSKECYIFFEYASP